MCHGYVIINAGGPFPETAGVLLRFAWRYRTFY